VFSALDAGNYFVEILMSTAPEMTALTTVGAYTVTLAEDAQFLDADFGLAASLPATGLEVGGFVAIGTLLLGSGILLLLLTRRRKPTLQA